MAWVPPSPFPPSEDQVRYVPVTGWVKTFRVIPVETISKSKKAGVLYKRKYRNLLRSEYTIYAENEFDILKYEKD